MKVKRKVQRVTLIYFCSGVCEEKGTSEISALDETLQERSLDCFPWPQHPQKSKYSQAGSPAHIC